MVNIAFIHEEFPFGGGETVTANLVSDLHKQGYGLFVLANKLHREQLPARMQGAECIALANKLKERGIVEEIAAIVKERSIDVLVVIHTSIIPYIPAIKKIAGCKVVFVLHNMPFYEKIYTIGHGKHQASKSIGKWLEWHLLRSFKYKFGRYDKKLKGLYRNIYDVVDAFGVLCDDYGKEMATKIGVNYENSKFYTLTNRSYPNEERVKDKEKIVCYIGRLQYIHKRVDRLLDIWKIVQGEHPDWQFCIVGNGEERAALEQQSRMLQLKNITFVGQTNDVQYYYDRAAIVCLASTYEGWPMVLSEAQANGCATIAFDCCAGIRELLSPSWENGVLIEPFDTLSYAKALSKLMSDDSLRMGIASKGFAHIKEYSKERVVKQWTDLIDKLIL